MLKRVLGLLGWLGVALVFAAVAIRFTKPELQQWYNGLALAGLACTLLYILSQWREVVRSFSGRQARFGALAVASAIVVLAILVAINYLAARHNKRWDLTAGGQFTLSDQTRRVLQELPRPVQLRVFARSDEFARFRQRLDEYEYVSDQVSVEYVDVERDPLRANQYDVQMSGTIVVEYDGRIERVTSDGEQEITNAIIKAIQGKQHKVYFVQGHGEKSPGESDRAGYSTIAQALTSDNFGFDQLVLAQQQAVPQDATVLVVAGPKTDMLPAEIDMLEAFLARGGKVLLMLDPPDKLGAPALTNITALVNEWGIGVGNDIVVDVSRMSQILNTGPEVPVAATYENHPITERFNLITAYSLARSISPAAERTSGRFPQSLVMTSANSWAETDVAGLLASGEVTRDLDKGDKAGPVSLAAAVSAPATNAPPARLAVFGDSDFASNGWLGIPGNRDLFLNTINWLAQQENLIAIRPKDPEDRRITLTADQERRIFWLTVLIIPGLILAAGIHTWWRRR
jgi:ABC-type uncharacterized transport system involved in gliding motility auxiliary subunit